jgi:hypothetical protein
MSLYKNKNLYCPIEVPHLWQYQSKNKNGGKKEIQLAPVQTNFIGENLLCVMCDIIFLYGRFFVFMVLLW